MIKSGKVVDASMKSCHGKLEMTVSYQGAARS